MNAAFYGKQKVLLKKKRNEDALLESILFTNDASFI
jgi:hypothetical protein